MFRRARLIYSTLLAFAAAASLHAMAAADTIQAKGGPITIQPIMHAALQLKYGNQVITVDPTGMGGDYNTLPKADTTVVIPSAALSQVKNGTVVANGEKKTIKGIEIEAVPMYNLQRGPAAGQLFHTKGRGNGYIVTLGDKRIYLAGDTECTPEMKALRNIDVAFVPMNLPYTMPPNEAADCVKAFKPKIVYPYHYMGSDLKVFENALNGSGVEVRIRDWYAK